MEWKKISKWISREHYIFLSHNANRKALENWMDEEDVGEPGVYSRQGPKWKRNYKHKPLKITLVFALIFLSWLNHQISLVQKMTSLITLFPIFPIIQNISMVYKLLKGQTKLVLLKGKIKKNIQALLLWKYHRYSLVFPYLLISDLE